MTSTEELPPGQEGASALAKRGARAIDRTGHRTGDPTGRIRRARADIDLADRITRSVAVQYLIPPLVDNTGAVGQPLMMQTSLEVRAEWLARFILPHEPALRRQLALWRLPPGLDADDVVQEAYAKLARLNSVAEIRSPKSYFFQTARSLILSHMRRARVVSIVTISDAERFDVASDEPTPEIQVSDRELLQKLAVAVAELPEPARRAFILRTITGLSHREVGSRLGISENAAQKMLAKSLGLLMKRIGYGGNEGRGASRDDVANGTGLQRDETRDKRGDQ